MPDRSADWQEGYAQGVRDIEARFTRDEQRVNRRALLASLNLNLNDCPRCRLPKVNGLVCVCGWDGSEETLEEKVQREFR